MGDSSSSYESNNGSPNELDIFTLAGGFRKLRGLSRSWILRRDLTFSRDGRALSEKSASLDRGALRYRKSVALPKILATEERSHELEGLSHDRRAFSRQKELLVTKLRSSGWLNHVPA